VLAIHEEDLILYADGLDGASCLSQGARGGQIAGYAAPHMPVQRFQTFGQLAAELEVGRLYTSSRLRGAQAQKAGKAVSVRPLRNFDSRFLWHRIATDCNPDTDVILWGVGIASEADRRRPRDRGRKLQVDRNYLNHKGQLREFGNPAQTHVVCGGIVTFGTATDESAAQRRRIECQAGFERHRPRGMSLKVSEAQDRSASGGRSRGVGPRR